MALTLFYYRTYAYQYKNRNAQDASPLYGYTLKRHLSSSFACSVTCRRYRSELTATFFLSIDLL